MSVPKTSGMMGKRGCITDETAARMWREAVVARDQSMMVVPVQAKQRLERNMVVTVEPGIYVRPAEGVPEAYWHTGIRIEDDVLVTADGHAILSTAPKTVADIEHLMKQ